MYNIVNIFIFCIFSLITQSAYADRCCKNECFEFKDSKQFCALSANDLQILSAGFLNNATIRSKHVIGNEVVDGTVTVLGNAEFNNGLVIDGDLIIDGAPFVPGASVFAYFAFTGTNVLIEDQALVPFDIDVQSTPGITLNGDGSFTLATPGIYMINFLVTIADTDSAFCLSTVPVGVASNIDNTTFARSIDEMSNVGFTIIQTTTPNTTIGVRSALTQDQTTELPAIAGATTAAVHIVKIA